jgi:hypothetical protein
VLVCPTTRAPGLACRTSHLPCHVKSPSTQTLKPVVGGGLYALGATWSPLAIPARLDPPPADPTTLPCTLCPPRARSSGSQRWAKSRTGWVSARDTHHARSGRDRWYAGVSTASPTRVEPAHEQPCVLLKFSALSPGIGSYPLLVTKDDALLLHEPDEPCDSARDSSRVAVSHHHRPRALAPSAGGSVAPADDTRRVRGPGRGGDPLQAGARLRSPNRIHSEPCCPPGNSCRRAAGSCESRLCTGNAATEGGTSACNTRKGVLRINHTPRAQRTSGGVG